MAAQARTILREYCDLGWHLIPIPAGSKGPRTRNWNTRELCISDPALAEWLDEGVGLAHAYSKTCAIDIDDLPKATTFLAERHIDLNALLNDPTAVRIVTRPGHAKLLYALDKPLPSFNLGPLELRCGSANGLTVQDVLPDSIHPDTGRPYEWGGADWHHLPPLPGNLANLWQSLVPATAPKLAHPTRKRRAAQADESRLRALLANHSPDTNYQDWINVGMSLHHETQGSDVGLALWNEWRSKATRLDGSGNPSYKGIGDLEAHWHSFRLDHDHPRTLASLRTETVADASEFPDLTGGKAVAPAADPRREAALQGLRTLKRNYRTGQIKALVSNVVIVLGVPEVAACDLAHDDFQDVLMITPPGKEQWRPLNDNDYTQLRIWMETKGNCEPVRHDMMRQSVMLAAEKNRMDTAQRWLDTLQWDGTERIDTFCSAYLGTKDTEYTRTVGAYLWTALAGRVIDPGCQADMVPVLIGRQGCGKSRGVQALVPSPEHYVELRLDEPDDTIARKCRGVLITELAEMRGLRTADLERTKAFITRTHEKWTPKYKEFATTYPRRFLIFGTTNDEEFLPADMEHRRWLPMHTNQVDVAAIARDRNQLWAEAAIRYTVDGIRWEGVDTLAESARRAASSEDGWENTVAVWLKDIATSAHIRMQDILVNAIGLDSRTVKRSDEQRVARILRGLGYAPMTARVEGKLMKVWTIEKS